MQAFFCINANTIYSFTRFQATFAAKLQNIFHTAKLFTILFLIIVYCQIFLLRCYCK